MKRVPLNQGKFSLVDDEDYGRITQQAWWFDGNYAAREENGKKIYMHRQLLGFPEEITDHINRDKLDNRRSNLRSVDQRLNRLNVGRRRSNTSGHTGLIWCKSTERWKAEVHVGGRAVVRYSKDKSKAIAINKQLRKSYYGVAI